jgi:hypothetical protein
MERLDFDTLTVPHVNSILRTIEEKGKLIGIVIFIYYYYYYLLVRSFLANRFLTNFFRIGKIGLVTEKSRPKAKKWMNDFTTLSQT